MGIGPQDLDVLLRLREEGYIPDQASVIEIGAQQLIDRFCGGSVEELLVGLVDHQVLQPKQLQRLSEKIAARKGKKS